MTDQCTNVQTSQNAGDPVVPLSSGDVVLTVRQQGLYMEDVRVRDLADRFGTPLYVMSERQLRHNIRQWSTAAERHWQHGPTLVLPALKANPSPALRKILNSEGAGCDVFGAGELEVALRSDVHPPHISLNGVTKSDTLLETAVNAGVMITLDSSDEFARVATIAERLGARAKIRFRVRPWLPSTATTSDFDPDQGPAYLALQHYRAGMPADEVAHCLPLAIDNAHVDPVGLHAHAGRHTTDLEFWTAYARDVGLTCALLADRFPQWQPRQIDLGGGYAVPRDPTRRNDRSAHAPTADEYLDALCTGLYAGLRRAERSLGAIELHIEPGRALYGNAGIHLAKVLHVKSQRTPLPLTWIETDTSEAFLPDTLIERNLWSTTLVDEPNRATHGNAAITGTSCGFDLLVPSQPLPRMTPDEIVAFLDTGAYQDSAANSFNHLPRPATVLVSGRQAELIKRRETFDDLTARDVVNQSRRIGDPPSGELSRYLIS